MTFHPPPPSRDIAAELETSSSSAQPPSHLPPRPSRSASAPSTPDAAGRVADALQRLHDAGLDSGRLPDVLKYYAATHGGGGEHTLPGTAHHGLTTHTQQHPVPADVVAHPSFQEVLQWLQAAGVGPEDVGVYLARQQQLAPAAPEHEAVRPPTVHAHAVFAVEDEEEDVGGGRGEGKSGQGGGVKGVSKAGVKVDVKGVTKGGSNAQQRDGNAAAVLLPGSTQDSTTPTQEEQQPTPTPIQSLMAHFADAGMPPALVAAALKTTTDGAVVLGSHPLTDFDGHDAVVALQGESIEARGAAALQFAAVLSQLEEEGIAPGDLAMYLVHGEGGGSTEGTKEGQVVDARSSDVMQVGMCWVLLLLEMCGVFLHTMYVPCAYYAPHTLPHTYIHHTGDTTTRNWHRFCVGSFHVTWHLSYTNTPCNGCTPVCIITSTSSSCHHSTQGQGQHTQQHTQHTTT